MWVLSNSSLEFCLLLSPLRCPDIPASNILVLISVWVSMTFGFFQATGRKRAKDNILNCHGRPRPSPTAAGARAATQPAPRPLTLPRRRHTRFPINFTPV